MANSQRIVAISTCHSFEDVHRLVMTMKMTELILNDRVQVNRKANIARIKAQLELDADCPNVTALFAA